MTTINHFLAHRLNMLGSLSNNRPSNDPPRVFFDVKVPSQFDDAEEENAPPLLDYLRSSYRGYPRKEERQIIKEAHVAASRAFLGAIRRDCQPRLNRAYEQSESLVAEKPVPSNNLHYYLSLDQLVQRQRATSTTTSARISLAAIPTKKSPQLLPAQRRQLNNNSTWLYQSHPMVSLLKDIDTTKNAFYTQKLSAGGPEKENPILEADIQPEDIICGRGGLAIHHEGNMEFRQLAYKYRKYYLRAPKIGKSQLCVNILEHIRSQKGRFLKKDKKTGFLYEQDDKTTVAKIGQLLREGTSKAKICRKYVDFDGARLYPRRTAEEQQTLAPLLEELAIDTQEAGQMPGMMRQEGGGGNAVSSLQRSKFSRSAGGHSNY